MEVPNVFISYSHDSPQHEDRVLAFADQLIRDGIDVILDQYELSPPEGWPCWMEKHLRHADFVLMVCTDTYFHRITGEEESGKGLGVKWEGNLIYQHIYSANTINTRFIPLSFEDYKFDHIPTPLRGVTIYRIDMADGYEELYRHITNQPRIKKPELGKLRVLPAREQKLAYQGVKDATAKLSSTIPLKMKRRKTSRNIQTEVLIMSCRRCCLCFGLSNTRDQDVKLGQIAHLDKNPNNYEIDNLAFLCLVHHDQYDGKTSQSKGFNIDEVKSYRNWLYDYFIPVRESVSCSIKNHNTQEKSTQNQVTQIDLISKIDLKVQHSTLKEIFLRFKEQFIQSNLSIAQIFKKIQEASQNLIKETGKPSYKEHHIDFDAIVSIYSGNYPQCFTVDDIEIISNSFHTPCNDLLFKNTKRRLTLDPVMDQEKMANIMKLISYYEKESGELKGWAEFLPCSLEPPKFMEAHHQALFKHIIDPKDRDKLIEDFNTIGHMRRKRVHSKERINTSTFTHLTFRSALDDIAHARGDYINISPILRRECLEFVQDKVADSQNRIYLIIADDDNEAYQVKRNLKGYDSMLLFGNYFTLWRDPNGTVFYSANESYVSKNHKIFNIFEKLGTKYSQKDVLKILATLIKKVK